MNVSASGIYFKNIAAGDTTYITDDYGATYYFIITNTGILEMELYYDGLGEASCNPAIGYHTGELEILYQREPSCYSSGSNGYEFCTVSHAYAKGEKA